MFYWHVSLIFSFKGSIGFDEFLQVVISAGRPKQVVDASNAAVLPAMNQGLKTQTSQKSKNATSTIDSESLVFTGTISSKASTQTAHKAEGRGNSSANPIVNLQHHHHDSGLNGFDVVIGIKRRELLLGAITEYTSLAVTLSAIQEQIKRARVSEKLLLPSLLKKEAVLLSRKHVVQVRQLDIILNPTFAVFLHPERTIFSSICLIAYTLFYILFAQQYLRTMSQVLSEKLGVPVSLHNLDPVKFDLKRFKPQTENEPFQQFYNMEKKVRSLINEKLITK